MAPVARWNPKKLSINHDVHQRSKGQTLLFDWNTIPAHWNTIPAPAVGVLRFDPLQDFVQVSACKVCPVVVAGSHDESVRLIPRIGDGSRKHGRAGQADDFVKRSILQRRVVVAPLEYGVRH